MTVSRDFVLRSIISIMSAKSKPYSKILKHGDIVSYKTTYHRNFNNVLTVYPTNKCACTFRTLFKIKDCFSRQ